ncbi:hypothetical protein Bca52824_001026 [Brassica carinata]|uniref:Malectin-like domain-containing protein n=1 Tax=Brassica carinata TaxID=52824 RepID=A0A8X7WI06_BRACI|nr:hypothetical protein Bca52824_001026 [Brassica carinata]
MGWLISSLMMAALLHLITIFSLLAVILSIAESINIDCGSTGSYVDSNNVTWVGDKGFVTTGEPVKIPNVVMKPLNTLRYFPTGQTNCYTNIPVAKRQKTLVRTKFYYENYDGNFSPPSFDLSLLNNEETFYYSELIFSPGNESISVCLLRTSPSDNPFISSIEVYSLDDGMYADLGPNEGLITQQRTACCAKENPYGRPWYPLGADDTLADLTTSAPSIDITGASNKPPEVVMSKASSSLGKIIKLSNLALPITGVPVYLALYFSEPQTLGRTQKRSFNVFLDETQVGSGPIIPVFGKATQVVLRDVVAMSGSQIVFQSTGDSVLPPIISGVDLFSISNSRNGGGGGGSQSSGGNNDSGGGAKSSGGKKKKKNKLPLIFGVTFASAFAILSSMFGAIFLRKRQNAKPQSNTTPTTSTGNGTGTGMSPLVEQQFASDTDPSYVVQDDHQ